MQRIATTSSNMRCLFRLQPFLCPNITRKPFPFPRSNPNRLTQYSGYHIKRIHLKPKKSLQTHAKKKQKQSEANGAIRSLFGEITDIIGDDSSVSGGNSSGEWLSRYSEQGTESTASVRENPQEKKDVSPMVHRVAYIVRGESDSGSMEDLLEKSGIEFYDPEIVEKVLKRCFKEPDSAMRFFAFVRRRDGFRHTSEIYNTMLYIAGEERDFDFVEKLVDDMERNSCEKDVKTWTILVSHYGDAKMIGKALASYDKMIKSGIDPDGAVYKSLIRSLCEVGEADIAMEFYKEMIKLEENPGLGLKLYRKLIGCLARSGDAIAVRSVADDMIRVSEISIEVVYGIVLKSFCVSGRIREALEFIRDPNNDEVSINYEHLETLAKGLCRADRVGDAAEIIEIAEKRGTADGEIYGIVVNGFLRRKEVSKALEVFERMKKSGHRASASTYTELMQNLFELDRYEEGCQLYTEMSESGVECDDVAITAVAAGHVQARRVDEARRVFATLVGPTWKAYSVLVRELCRISSSDEILEVLDEMRGSEIPIGDEIFGWVTSHFERSGEEEKLERLKRIQRAEKGVNFLDDNPPRKTHDEEDLESLLKILLPQPRKWAEILEGLEKCEVGFFTPELVSEVLRRCKANGSVGLRFFSWVKRRGDFEHSPESYNAAMKLAGQGKDFRHMRELLREMRRNRVTVSPDTWTIMIMQYGRTGLTEMALDTFKEMRAERCEPNASTYKYLITTLCGKKGRKPEEAKKLFKEMIKSGFFPDKELVETYLGCLCETQNLSAAKKCVNFLQNKAGFSVALSFSLFVRALCRARKVDEALDVIRQAGAERESLELYTYGSVFHGLLRMNRLDEALEKIESMKSAGISPTVHVYTSLIVHYLKEKELEKALETMEKMREEGIEPTTVTHSAFIRGYVGLGRPDEAWKVFDRMKREGPSPDFRTYSMFIDVLCRVGKSEEAMKLLEEMLRCGVVPSTINFRTVFHGLNREGKHSLAQAIMHRKFNLARKRKFLL